MAKCGAFQARYDGSHLSCILPNTSPLSLACNVIYAVLVNLRNRTGDKEDGKTCVTSVTIILLETTFRQTSLSFKQIFL